MSTTEVNISTGLGGKAYILKYTQKWKSKKETPRDRIELSTLNFIVSIQDLSRHAAYFRREFLAQWAVGRSRYYNVYKTMYENPAKLERLTKALEP